jgi:hypothetical protein
MVMVEVVGWSERVSYMVRFSPKECKVIAG